MKSLNILIFNQLNIWKASSDSLSIQLSALAAFHNLVIPPDSDNSIGFSHFVFYEQLSLNFIKLICLCSLTCSYLPGSVSAIRYIFVVFLNFFFLLYFKLTHGPNGLKYCFH